MLTRHDGRDLRVGRSSVSPEDHAKLSMKANPSARARAIWLDPAFPSNLLIMPDWEQMIWETLKSIQRTQLQRSQKIKCAMTVLGVHSWRRYRNAGGRLKDHTKGYPHRFLIKKIKQSELYLERGKGIFYSLFRFFFKSFVEHTLNMHFTN